MSQRTEESRANFAVYQDKARPIASGTATKLEVVSAVQDIHQFLKDLSAGSPVDHADHFGVLTTREERIEHIQRFAKRRGIVLEVAK